MTSQHFPASKVPSGLSSGSRLAGYLLEEQIGEGGMAVVFRAHEERLGRTVALKVLAPALASDVGFRQRFVRESRAAAAVDDPHIIPVFEAGEADGVLFIAMRFVRGGDVRSLVASHGPLPAGRAISIIAQAASALDAAHRRGLVHRDVKPANMLLDRSADVGTAADHVYLSDFGLSKAAMHATGLTGTGMFLGTIDYISPEQIEGRPVDGRADQYSLGCAAFEMLSGSPPFRRDDLMALMYAQMHAAPPLLTCRRTDLPPKVDDAFARALAKSPAERYGTCTQFADAVRQALGETVSIAATIDSPIPQKNGELFAPAGRVTAGRRPPTEVVPVVAGAIGLPGAAGSAGNAGLYAGKQSRSRRLRRQLLLIGACMLAAAGLVSGAVLLRSPGPASAGSQGSAPPRRGPAHSSQPSAQARSSSPIPGGAGQGAPQSAPRVGYKLAARLNPGPSTASISGVAWDPAGRLIAASDKNGDTYVWNADTRAMHGPVLAGPDRAYYTAFSPDGSVIATGYKNGSTYLWSTATGRILARLHDPGPANGKEVDSLAFSPDGQTLATSDGNGYTTLWDARTPGSEVTRTISLADPAGSGVYSVVFSANGVLATGDYSGHVYLWDAASGADTATFSLPAGSCTVPGICDAVSGLTFSPDGSVLAAATIRGSAELWSVPGRRAAVIPVARQGNAAIWGMSLGKGSTLAVACANGRLSLWHINPRTLTATPAGGMSDPGSGPEGVGAVTLSADGHYLVAGDTNGSAYLWKLSTPGAVQAWTSARLVITPRSLGAVAIGMTAGQASAAAGERLAPVGDGVWYPGGVKGSGLSVLVSGGRETVSCVAASERPGGAAVITPQGFRLGGTLAQLKALYRNRIRYVPAPAGGIMPLPGYVVSFQDGNLVFWAPNGTIVNQIAAGPGVLPSTDCV